MSSHIPSKIFGTGLITLDIVISGEPRTPVRDWAGGTCGNVMAILSFLGWEVFPIARLSGDLASIRVKSDLTRWGVKLDYAECSPTSHTPIVVQEIKRGRDGSPRHRFIWSCPNCGERLPAFKPITRDTIAKVSPAMKKVAVFFLDRLSRGTLTLAAQAAEEGALIVFEPSGKSVRALFNDAIKLAHIIKYSDQRMSGIDEAMKSGTNNLVEIQTLGINGLRFRDRLSSKLTRWMRLPAVKAPYLADSCGAGDWCTAGFLSQIGEGGLDGFLGAGRDDLKAALDYGQLLAAWNCSFEGARGGMYEVKNKHKFDKQIEALMLGVLKKPTFTKPLKNTKDIISCPSCSS